MNEKNQKTEYLLPDVKTFEFATCSNNIFNLTFKFKNKTIYNYIMIQKMNIMENYYMNKMKMMFLLKLQI